MGVFPLLMAQDHESVAFFSDGAAHLKAIIAIHSTRLGPAVGGVRMRPYETEEAALLDALRLCRGMTYKAAVTGREIGGWMQEVGFTAVEVRPVTGYSWLNALVIGGKPSQSTRRN